MHGQTGLADPRRTGQRDEPVGVERAGDGRQLAGPTDQRRRLERQVVTVGIQRPQRREVASQFRVRELVHQLRSDQVLQLVRPQIDQPSTVRESIEHQLGGGPRHDHLPTVGAGP